MTLFLDINFIYRYSMEVDGEKIYTYNILVGACLWFCRLDVGLQLVALDLYPVSDPVPGK